MSFWTHNRIKSACNGRWLARSPHCDDPDAVEGVSIDSRTIRPHQAFIAIRGERHDGHDYIPQAVEAGASLLLISDAQRLPSNLPKAVSVIRVADTAEALLRLAAAYRKTLEGTRVIAVTGSNGKTTTCRIIHTLLASRLRGVVSEKSFNNSIGVPLTILRARPGDHFLICEVGMNAPGEIAQLARIVEPDIAVITSIGRAHLEGLGSVEAIAREKASLISYLRPGGLAIATADTPLLDDVLKTAPNAIRVGLAESADHRVTDIEHIPARNALRFRMNARAAYELPFPGRHNALNAAAAIAVARRLGLEHDEIAEALLTAEPPPMRFAVSRAAGATLYNDAYNANPDSTAAAIATFSEVAAAAKRRIIILGDMLELGPEAPALHAEVAESILAARNIDLVITVGDLALHTAERLQRDWPAERVELFHALDSRALDRIAARVREGDAILLKGSRGAALERIESALADRAPHSTHPAVATPRQARASSRRGAGVEPA